MKRILIIALFLVMAAGSAWAADENGQSLEEPLYLASVMCFLKGEQISNMNKICYYDCVGSLTAMTVKSYQLCPLSINR